MDDDTTRRRAQWVRGRGLAVGLFLIVVIATVPRALTLAQPLVEAHEFRQTQTAYTAVIYHRLGVDLLQTPLPVLGAPWVVPYEFPLFQALAAIVMDVGVPTEVALRTTSLGFFIVSAALVWLIVRLEAGRRTAAIATAAFVLSPLGFLWSRSSTVETIAVAAALATVLEAMRWDRSGSRRHLAAAVALGAVAGLLKITTAAIWLAPALLFLRRSSRATIGVVGIAACAGLAWTVYADGIKEASPATAFLTSSALREWNFGTLEQRLDPATWASSIGWLAGLGLLVFLAPLRSGRSRLSLWCVTTLALGPLVFTNLYAVHDYYWMAVAPAAAILIGLFATSVLEAVPVEWRRAWALGLAALFALSFVAYQRWLLPFSSADTTGVLAHAAQIAAETDPDDLLAITHDTWNPAILFYADRRGYMEFDRVPPAPGVHPLYLPGPRAAGGMHPRIAGIPRSG